MRKMFQIRKHDDRWREKERGDLEDEKKDVGDGDDLEKELFLREKLPFCAYFLLSFSLLFGECANRNLPCLTREKKLRIFVAAVSSSFFAAFPLLSKKPELSLFVRTPRAPDVSSAHSYSSRVFKAIPGQKTLASCKKAPPSLDFLVTASS